MGTQKLFDFIDDNPFVVLNRADYVNHTSIIMQVGHPTWDCKHCVTWNQFFLAIVLQNPKVTAINSCIEVDLTGQVCADSIGTRIYSGMYSISSHAPAPLPFQQSNDVANPQAPEVRLTLSVERP